MKNLLENIKRIKDIMSISENKKEDEMEIDETEISEEDAPSTSTETETTSTGAGTASVWDSGVQRGPANQVGNTKWSDTVGAQLKRGKANMLK